MFDKHVHLSFFRMSFHILMPGLTWASSAVSIISGFWILVYFCFWTVWQMLCFNWSQESDSIVEQL